MRIRLLPALLGLLLLAGCVPGSRRASWKVYPLPRREPHDGVAVVTRPGGEGLHIWLDPDTSQLGVCRPRWNPDAARLSGGDGDAPASQGRAPRDEFYAAMRRGRVRWVLRRESEALCRARSPRSDFQWVEPPRSAAGFRPTDTPPVEERDLLPHPKAILREEKRMLGIPLVPEDFEEDRTRPPEGP
ncbi:MAG: hypothetical protein VKI81_08690 [Synechococcaceae cyanobacterium]|nr:hypothetical protein [Synechococcaceae cyanobacterium]